MIPPPKKKLSCVFFGGHVLISMQPTSPTPRRTRSALSSPSSHSANILAVLTMPTTMTIASTTKKPAMLRTHSSAASHAQFRPRVPRLTRPPATLFTLLTAPRYHCAHLNTFSIASAYAPLPRLCPSPRVVAEREGTGVIRMDL